MNIKGLKGCNKNKIKKQIIMAIYNDLFPGVFCVIYQHIRILC
jgi:hypothetical protein